jgi:hypothetical protein
MKKQQRCSTAVVDLEMVTESFARGAGLSVGRKSSTFRKPQKNETVGSYILTSLKDHSVSHCHVIF